MRRDRLSARVSPAWTMALVAAVTPVVATASLMACAYAGAARARRLRRDGCPFENDDDAARPIATDATDVLRETAALLAALVPGAVASGEPHDGAPGLRVVLVPEWGLPARSLAPLARRVLVDVPGARIEPEPRRHPWSATAERVPRLAERLDALARSGAGTILVVGHGRGGVVAREAAAGLRHRDRLRVVTIATPHVGPEGGGAPRGAGDVRLLSLYSLHDAVVTPPERSYVSGALNVVVRDDGHFGIVRAPRTAVLLREALFDAPAAAAAGA